MFAGHDTTATGVDVFGHVTINQFITCRIRLGTVFFGYEQGAPANV